VIDYAGFWLRLVAFLLDWLLVFVVLGPFVILLARPPWELAALLLVAAAVLLFWRAYGATPGKIAVAAKIVDARTGAAPSTGRLALRLAGYLVSAAPLYLGFLWIAFDRRKQGWHDKIAGTVVILDDD
jgi:uncharacterized RDD family membrane protein YckC